MKLNIGCGKKYEPNYCNIDLHESLVADKLMSAVNLQFEDNSSEEIKAVQLIEHLTFFEAIYALSEFYRVLEPGGKLIVETPDLKKVCQHYLNSNDDQKKQILGWIYGIPHKGLQHKLCFPPFLLIELLEQSGFFNITTSNFYNHDFIPSVRFECTKDVNNDQHEVFQIITKLRKELISNGQIYFNDSFLIKEQEDLISFIRSKLDEVKTNQSKKTFYELFIELLIKWPDVVDPLLVVIKDGTNISQAQYSNIKGVAELMIEINIVNILYNSIKEGPINPGSQKIVLFAIESFAKKIIEKLLYSNEDRTSLVKNLINLSQDSKENGNKIYSTALVEKKSFDLYYLGIKSFHKEKYKQAHNLFLRAIKFNRDNYLFFWYLAKTLAKLKSFSQAEKIYKKTLHLIKKTNVQNKQEFKSQIQNELNQIKERRSNKPNFNLAKI